MSEYGELPLEAQQQSRELPAKIVIPPIRGEMVHLRPATVEDLARLDELDAFYNAPGITGKDQRSERLAVSAWVRRSVAWAEGLAPAESGVGDPELRRTIAWAMVTDADHDDDGAIDASNTGNVIGMIFLIDIDGWSRSARIQVILGKDYRGRGYSRDAMPRVMTYGFAPTPAGLGMHRIWVAVPEANTRSRSVYQSLGFVPSGTSRDALWDAEHNKYQDLIVMDTLADEYDPIRSLDAFGMHVYEDNPGVKEALSTREHSIAIQVADSGRDTRSERVGAGNVQYGDAAFAQGGNGGRPDASETMSASRSARQAATAKNDDRIAVPSDEAVGGKDHPSSGDENDRNIWPYNSSERKPSQEAWWRVLGRGRKRETEGM